MVLPKNGSKSKKTIFFQLNEYMKHTRRLFNENIYGMNLGI
jgi:hypothetical protein